MNRYDPYRQFCEARKTAQQFRQLQETRILPDGFAERAGQRLINFSSNDYLGLSQHPALLQRAQEYAARFGVGSTASRLITGNIPGYAKIEQDLARGKGSETALIMNSGYQANMTILSALADPDVVGKPVTVLADRLSHNSLLQGVMSGGARLARFHHNNYDHLEQLLAQQTTRGTHVIIVTESVFGMDGDRADLPRLIALAHHYNALLYVDEAHATGVFGENGFGLTADHKGQIDLVMGTFGKALGSFGAYVACNHVLRDYLVQRCGGLIYSTGLPPAILGSIEAALEIIPSLGAERLHLQQQASHLRQQLTWQGWNCGSGTTQIIPVIMGDEQAAIRLAEILRAKDILVPAIRPPTVPRGTSRLRLSLSAVHKPGDIQYLIDVMAEQADSGDFQKTETLAS